MKAFVENHDKLLIWVVVITFSIQSSLCILN